MGSADLAETSEFTCDTRPGAALSFGSATGTRSCGRPGAGAPRAARTRLEVYQVVTRKVLRRDAREVERCAGGRKRERKQHSHGCHRKPTPPRPAARALASRRRTRARAACQRPRRAERSASCTCTGKTPSVAPRGAAPRRPGGPDLLAPPSTMLSLNAVGAPRLALAAKPSGASR